MALYGNYLGFNSILNIGTRPTFKETEPVIEVHLFDFNGKLYNREIEVSFVKRLRAERRFKNKDHLREQIAKDASIASSILEKSARGQVPITSSSTKGPVPSFRLGPVPNPILCFTKD